MDEIYDAKMTQENTTILSKLNLNLINN